MNLCVKVTFNKTVLWLQTQYYYPPTICQRIQCLLINGHYYRFPKQIIRNAYLSAIYLSTGKDRRSLLLLWHPYSASSMSPPILSKMLRCTSDHGNSLPTSKRPTTTFSKPRNRSRKVF